MERITNAASNPSLNERKKLISLGNGQIHRDVIVLIRKCKNNERAIDDGKREDAGPSDM